MDSDQSAGSSQTSSRQNSVDQSSRQNSLDSDSGTGAVPAAGAVRAKDLVHKCHSDPGGGRTLVAPGAGAAPPRPVRHRSTGGSARRCVLTLDGYSYVIGELCLIYFQILVSESCLFFNSDFERSLLSKKHLKFFC